MPLENISGILAKEKLAEKERQEFAQKIEGINKQVQSMGENFTSQFRAINEQMQALVNIPRENTDSEVLKNWEGMTSIQRDASPVIPRGAYMTEFRDILSNASNKPGLVKKLFEVAGEKELKDELSRRESNAPEKLAEAFCTGEQCRIRVSGAVRKFQEKHHLKKNSWLEK